MSSSSLLLLILLIINFFIVYIYMTSNNVVFKMKNFSNLILQNEKVIVFDMDETLGHFVQIGSLCNLLEIYFKKKINQTEFNKIMDLYPEILRPNILSLLEYIKIQKMKLKCSKVIIYTNNQGPKEWALKIGKYLNYKLGFKLFDQVIGSKFNEPCRTTHRKTFSDLKKCANLPNNVRVCFIDDLYHRDMDKQHIQYIMVEPYVVGIPNNLLIQRLYSSNIFIIYNRYSFINFINNKMDNYRTGNFNIKNNNFLYQNVVSFLN